MEKGRASWLPYFFQGSGAFAQEQRLHHCLNLNQHQLRMGTFPWYLNPNLPPVLLPTQLRRSLQPLAVDAALQPQLCRV